MPCCVDSRSSSGVCRRKYWYCITLIPRYGGVTLADGGVAVELELELALERPELELDIVKTDLGLETQVTGKLILGLSKLRDLYTV